MITKKFNYKGQMINYFNKVKNNPNIGACYGYYSCEYKSYVVEYYYKDR